MWGAFFRPARSAPVEHVFTSATLSAGAGDSIELKQVMIDSGSTFNLISRLAVAEHQLHGTDDLPPGIECLDGHPLRLYQRFQVSVRVRDAAGVERTLSQDLYSVEMTGMDMILGMAWLEEALPIVNYGSKTFLYEGSKLSNVLPIRSRPSEMARGASFPQVAWAANDRSLTWELITILEENNFLKRAI